MPDWGPWRRHKYHKGMEVLGNSHWPASHWGSMFHAAETTKPCYDWGKKNYVLEFAMVHPPRWVSYLHPLNEGKLFNLHWNSVVLMQDGPVEIYTWNRTHITERKEKIGVLVWHILSPGHLLMPGSAASRRGMYNQVRFLKLPTFLSSSQVGTFCFLLVSYLAAIFAPHWFRGGYGTQRSPY